MPRAQEFSDTLSLIRTNPKNVEHVYDGDGNEIAFSRSSDGGTRAKGDDTFKISIGC